MTDRLKLAAEALVKRFEYESMALHKTQREWLVREITSALRASAPPDAGCREALERCAECKCEHWKYCDKAWEKYEAANRAALAIPQPGAGK